MSSKAVYRAFNDSEIELIMPWPDGFDMIPPPTIEFYKNGQKIIFGYTGGGR